MLKATADDLVQGDDHALFTICVQLDRTWRPQTRLTGGESLERAPRVGGGHTLHGGWLFCRHSRGRIGGLRRREGYPIDAFVAWGQQAKHDGKFPLSEYNVLLGSRILKRGGVV